MTVAGKETVRPSQAAAATAGGADALAAAAGEAPMVGIEEGQEMNFLPPNMPGFSELDLQFICTFTEVGRLVSSACLGKQRVLRCVRSGRSAGTRHCSAVLCQHCWLPAAC